jgi:hypothetical protein
MVNAWKPIVAALVIFCAGLITGALGVRLLDKSAMKQQRQQSSQAGPGTRQAGDFLHRLDKQLQLTPPQHERIGAILKESQERTRHIYGKVDPQMRDELRQTRERIKGELAPSQLAIFEKLQVPNNPRKKEEGTFRDPRWERRRDPPARKEGSTNAPPPVEPPSKD